VETRSVEYAEIEIYDTKGRLIKTLTVTDDMLRSDGAVIRWDGTDAAGKSVCSGIYFYRLSLDGTNYIQSKMILLK
jgi:flagellar hook assembly protein FlgD